MDTFGGFLTLSVDFSPDFWRPFLRGFLVQLFATLLIHSPDFVAPNLKINLGFQVKLGVLDPKAASTASEYFHAGLHLRAFAVVVRRLPAGRCSVHNMDWRPIRCRRLRTRTHSWT